MGTSFIEIYNNILVVIEDYRIDNKYKENKEVVYSYFNGFIISGLPNFNCLQSLDYEVVKENIGTESEPIMVDRYYFLSTLTRKEIDIVSKLAVSAYLKRKIQDIKAENSSMGKREFSKGNIEGIQKEKRRWYNMQLNEIDRAIKEYQMENIGKLPFWSGFNV